MLLLGELDKQVPMSPQRVSALSLDPDDIRITFVGPPGEEVLFSVWFNDMLMTFGCVITEFGSSQLSLLNKSC